jgi:hypothetical protein
MASLPPLSKSDAKLVLRLVRGRSDDDQVLNEAASSIESIRSESAVGQWKQRKKALQRVAKKIDAAIDSIETLPIAIKRAIDPKLLRKTIKPEDTLFPEWGHEVVTQSGSLYELRDQIKALAEKIPTKAGGKLSGQGNFIAAAQKREAADCAFDMLATSSDAPTKNAHRKLTALLFELATKTADDVDVERACNEVYEARLGGKRLSGTPEILKVWAALPSKN